MALKDKRKDSALITHIANHLSLLIFFFSFQVICLHLNYTYVVLSSLSSH